MKTNNFNFEQFKNGKKAQTKLGNPAKFLCMDRNTGKMLIEITTRLYTKEQVKYCTDGRKYPNTDTIYDLEMA